jgi:hypothetical protein
MSSADHAPSAAPIPPELAALDFDPFTAVDADAEQRACGALVELTRREVTLRIDLARATRWIVEAEAEYLAAASEDERRTWRERARLAEHAAALASTELRLVLTDRTIILRDLVDAQSVRPSRP